MFVHTINGVTDSNVNPFALSKTGKKPGARKRVCKPGVPKERHITVLEVSSKRTRALGSSPHHYVEAQSGREGPGDTTSTRYSFNFLLHIVSIHPSQNNEGTFVIVCSFGDVFKSLHFQ